MSIITMAQTKGGAGKTTIAQLIVGVVKAKGYSVAVIDGDVNLGSGDDTFTLTDTSTVTGSVNGDEGNVKTADEEAGHQQAVGPHSKGSDHNLV